MLKKLLKDKSGNFGILAAVAIVPILGMAGMAIDFTRAMQLRSELQNAADAAVIGALSEKSAGMLEAINMSGDGVVKLSEKEGLNLFAAQLAHASGGDGEPEKKMGIAGEPEGADSDLDVNERNVTISVTKTGKDLRAELTYEIAIKTSLLHVIGKDSIKVSGKAVAVYQTQSFMDFYMLLDNTPSMGVGATPADVDKLIKATKNVKDPGSKNCAFACHIVSEKGVEDKTSNYFVARNVGATIRIDVVAKAVAALTEEATKTQSYSNQFRMAAYTFGETAMDVKLLKVADLSSNLSTVKNGTQNIKLMSIPFQGYNNDQQTSFDNVLTKISDEITAPGNGTSSASPEKIVYFVSDGVGDSYKPKGCTKRLTGSRCQEPIDLTYCTALKNRGIKIAVLYTTYLPLPNNDWYNSWIKPFQSEISTRMQSCASPGLFFEVSPTQGIEAAMKALFNKVVRSPRLQS
ncbi:TadE/TadG family type IV pilus assembly protein [Pararhizobium antarcticum]|uniref:Putative Flp pilus-assembly TadG-like N-terminal domain-containing protein n=1 Tax=Pararhizobium antarcticum TaxID=1798805 RepID=A0A657M064_9HYPH|nr:Tad domain-containing protein [Pararhizobium antarcticum]OJF94106.1 hypothetical protein AX761_19140 [Rhizobium sp. 58]OJF99592.1 hypothetical protein AX760_12670 [Pararhizobium antarcticum]